MLPELFYRFQKKKAAMCALPAQNGSELYELISTEGERVLLELLIFFVRILSKIALRKKQQNPRIAV